MVGGIWKCCLLPFFQFYYKPKAALKSKDFLKSQLQTIYW